MSISHSFAGGITDLKGYVGFWGEARGLRRVWQPVATFGGLVPPFEMMRCRLDPAVAEQEDCSVQDGGSGIAAVS